METPKCSVCGCELEDQDCPACLEVADDERAEATRQVMREEMEAELRAEENAEIAREIDNEENAPEEEREFEPDHDLVEA